HHGGNDEPRHGDQRFRRLVMFFVPHMGRGPAFVIDPSMKSVFKQTPTQEARAEADADRQDTAAQDERFPEQKEKHSHRIADKAEPVVAAAGRQTDQVAFSGTTKWLLFSVLVDRHSSVPWLFREAYDTKIVLFCPQDIGTTRHEVAYLNKLFS